MPKHPTSPSRINVGILLFNEVDLLDFAGPFEVFQATRLSPGATSRFTEEDTPFRVFTVSRSLSPVRARGGLMMTPAYAFGEEPSIDLLVVPGGLGTRALLQDKEIIEWIGTTASAAKHTASICTGALLLGKAGLLRGRRATTHWAALDLLASIEPTASVDKTARFVDDGVLTSAGVSAGIDLAFYIVEKLLGRSIADDTANYLDYVRTRT